MTNILKISIFKILFLCSYNSLSQNNYYNNIYSIACHNCYDKQYASKLEEVFQYTNVIEIDVWDSKLFSGGWKALNRDWYVKHSPFTYGNYNCCGGSLSDCLGRIKTWLDYNYNHDPITIFIDKKENWSNRRESRKPKDLDYLIESIFTRAKIFTPKMLKNADENLKAAAIKGNWPNVDSIRGKLLFVITNGTLLTRRNVLNEYLNSRKDTAICFVAPEIKCRSQINRLPGISMQNALNIVFYNLKYKHRYLAEIIHSSHFISRIYGSPENIESYNNLKALKINFIALFNYKLAINQEIIHNNLH